MAVSHCSTCWQRICSIVYLFTWLLLIVGLILFHVGLQKLIPPLEDLPENLEKGFDVVFGFASLESSARDIEAHSRQALLMCGVSMTQLRSCDRIPTPVPQWKMADTNPKRRAIKQIFENVLARIQRITNDKYFGTEALQSTANNLNTILQKLNEIEEDPMLNHAGHVECVGTNPLYCEINDSAGDIISGVAKVDAEMKKFTNNDVVEQFKDYRDYIDYLHALPYILVISALFFCCIWWFDGRCCHSKKGCCALILHLFFWLVFFIVTSVVCAVGFVIRYKKDEVSIDELNGEPNLDEVLTHISKYYPEFHALVIADLEEGGESFFYAAFVFEAFCIIIVMYGFVVCCCKPYDKKMKVKPAPD